MRALRSLVVSVSIACATVAVSVPASARESAGDAPASGSSTVDPKSEVAGGALMAVWAIAALLLHRRLDGRA